MEEPLGNPSLGGRFSLKPTIPLGEARLAMAQGFQMMFKLGGNFDEFGVVVDWTDLRVNNSARQFHHRKELFTELAIGSHESAAMFVLGGVIASG